LITSDDREIPLAGLLKDCSGEHKGGLMFYANNGNVWILKCDAENNCERLEKRSIDDDDWVYIGKLVDPRGPDIPYT